MANEDKRLWRCVRSALRRVWLYYGLNHREAMAAAKDGDRWRCEKCKERFLAKDVRRDHVVPCGSLQGLGDVRAFCDRLFYGKIQILCKREHDIKTAEEAKARRKK